MSRDLVQIQTSLAHLRAEGDAMGHQAEGRFDHARLDQFVAALCLMEAPSLDGVLADKSLRPSYWRKTVAGLLEDRGYAERVALEHGATSCWEDHMPRLVRRDFGSMLVAISMMPRASGMVGLATVIPDFHVNAETVPELEAAILQEYPRAGISSLSLLAWATIIDPWPLRARHALVAGTLHHVSSAINSRHGVTIHADRGNAYDSFLATWRHCYGDGARYLGRDVHDPPSAYALHVRQGTLWRLLDQGSDVGLISIASKSELGLRGWIICDLFVEPAARGMHVGRSAQILVAQEMLRRGSVASEFLIGTIGCENAAALRSARSVGRIPIATYYWLDVGS